jgi:hypothetical protein
MGYTQATCAWKLFIFSSFFHTNTIPLSIIWDSQPWVQPWAIPRLHFHESCSYSLHIFTPKTIHIWLLGNLNPLYSSELYTGYMFMKAVHILFTSSHKNNTFVDDCGLSILCTALGYIQATFFTKCRHFLFTCSHKNNTFVYYWGLSTLGTALGYTQATCFTKCCHLLFTCSHKNNTLLMLTYVDFSS